MIIKLKDSWTYLRTETMDPGSAGWIYNSNLALLLFLQRVAMEALVGILIHSEIS